MPLDTPSTKPSAPASWTISPACARSGMGMAEEIAGLSSKVAAEGTHEAVESCGVLSLAFSRVSRSVRQVVALEEEAMGLRAMRKARARRNADTAEALRLRVGGAVRERVPGIDKAYLEGLLSDLFRDYDDYADVSTGDIGPVLARIRAQLGQDRESEAWPAPPTDDPYALERDEDLDRRIMDERDRIAAAKAEQEAMTDAERKADAVRRWRGLDPP